MKAEERQEYRNRLGRLGLHPPVAKVYARDVEESPCSVCGGSVRGNDCEWWGPWRRHLPCGRLVGDETGRLITAARKLAVGDLNRIDATLVEFRVNNYAEVHESPVWTGEKFRDRMPWKHVDRRALAKAVKTLPRLRRRAGLDPSRCRDGACGWCGVAESCGWHKSRQTWPDGSPAPLCRGCHEVDVRHGRPSHPDDLPAALAEAITGAPVLLGEQPPTGLVPFCESGSRAGQEPWAHLPTPAVDGYRWWVWGRFGAAYAPPERREEALARWEAAEAAKRVLDGEKAALAVVRADTFGFTDTPGGEVTP
jgi:hypothetical protein